MSDPAAAAPAATKKPSLPPADKVSGRKRTNWRKVLFRLHGWLGLNVGLLLFVICFSGSVATLSHEIDWLLNPDLRAPVQAQPYDWTAMHQALRAAFPEGENLGVYAPEEPGFAAVSYVTVPNGQTRKVYLNPYSGAVQGHTSFFNVQRFFRSFHRRFFDGDRGIVLVTLCAFVLLLAAATGFTYYKGWLKQLFRLRRGNGPRLLWSDLHKGAGIWGLAFTLLTALTGVFYFVEVGFQEAGRYDKLLPPPLPEVEEASLTGYGPQPKLLPAGRYVQAAQAALPGLRVRSVRMPHRPGEAAYVDGQAGNPLTRDRANKVLLHPFSGDVLAVQKSTELGVVPFITDAVDPLHFGYFGGLWTKVLWCALGLLLSFSILAGAYLWVVRSQPRRRGRACGSREAKKWRMTPFLWLRGALVATALTLAYFFVVVFATVDGIRAYGPQHPPAAVVDTATVGPHAVRLSCAAPCHLEDGAAFTARFGGEGLPNYHSVSLGADTSLGTAAAVALEGPARAPTATATAPRGTPLRLRLVTRAGAVHAAAISASALEAARSSSAAYEPALPDTASGVWWVVGIFVVAVVGVIVAWLLCLARAFQAIQQKARRAGFP